MKHTIITKKAWIPDNFTLESHTDLGKLDVSKIKMELYLSEKQKTGYIQGEDLLKEVKNPLNSTVLKYLLDNPTLIPEEWKGKYVYFFGTVLRDSRGDRYVLYLYWHDGRWGWHVNWLDRDWRAYRPSVVLASQNLKLKSSELSDTLPLILEINGIKYKKI